MQKTQKPDTFSEDSVVSLPNGGTAIMFADGRMAAYSVGNTVNSRFRWVRKGIDWKTIGDALDNS